MSVTTQETDLVELLRAGQGDMVALAALFDRHTPRLFSTAVAILGNESEAAEIVHATWMELWTRARPYDGRAGDVASCLLARTRAAAIERLRERPVPQEAERLVRAAAGPQRLVPPALAELPVMQRRALETAFLLGYQPCRLAGHLEVEPAMARDLVLKGLDALAPPVPEEARR
jgi:RNA polymerase sigma-70 factor, ECF subfamily